jgi:ABC-type branched-subunit amino acid transport system ATPase component
VVRTFQAPQTFDDLSCIDNVLLSSPERAATGIASAWTMRRRVLRHERRRWERATSVLERVGLTYRAQDPAASLPYGEKRLLELARAIAGDPEVLLLDEPAAGLSAVETEALSRLLDSLRSQGIGMVLVDHKLDFLKALCDEITVLELGSVIASGSFDEVFGSSRVIDAYLGVPEVI